MIDVHRFVWHKTNEMASGFHTFHYDLEEIVVGYFRQAVQTEFGDPRPSRPRSLFDFKHRDQRSSLWTYPRGTPFRDSGHLDVKLSSVWNLDMLLRFFETCLQPEDIFCDMFAGTGTAAIAALYRGCHVHIVEKRPEHLSLCKTRINSYLNKVTRNMFKFNDLSQDITKYLQPDDVSVLFYK